MNRLLLALALVLSACQSSDDASESAPAMVAAMAVPPPTDEAGAQTRAAASAATARRVLIRTATLRLRVRDYERARRDAGTIARRHGAFVSGEREERFEGDVSNTLTLRVEAARFDTLMDALVGLGDIEERRIEVDDVTEQSADLDARLRSRRAVEARYVEILGRAGSIEDVLAVEARLGETREAIERAEAELRGLRDRVALSTVTLTLTERSTTGLPGGPGFLSRLADAFAVGWDGLLGLTLGLVALWPLAPIGAVLVLAWRAYRRRFPKRDRTVA